MPVIGKTSEVRAVEFVSRNPLASLGSMTSEGFRRVSTDATGEELERQKSAFAMIATGPPSPEQKLVVVPDPVPCIHRGSARNVCCGSPNLWICRHHKVDCVATLKDKQSLLSMVQTTEASSLLTCDTCKDRLDPNEQIILEAMPDSTNPVAHAD